MVMEDLYRLWYSPVFGWMWSQWRRIIDVSGHVLNVESTLTDGKGLGKEKAESRMALGFLTCTSPSVQCWACLV